MPTRPTGAWRFSLCLLFGYWALAFVATHLPGQTVSRLGRDFSFRFENMDKVAHFALYAGLACLLMWFFHRRGRGKDVSAFMTLAVALSYGALDEWLQSFIPRRSMDFGDWVADAVGVLGGILFYYIAHPVFTNWLSGTRARVAWPRRQY